MANEYRPALEVQEIAERLIPKYHQHLLDYDVKIEYVFSEKVPKVKGQEVWILCKKVTNLNAFLANYKEGSDPFFVVIVPVPIWDVLPEDKREILVDYGLCHANVEVKEVENDDGEMENEIKLSIRPYDYQEFSCIGRRYGAWRESAEEFINNLKKD